MPIPTQQQDGSGEGSPPVTPEALTFTTDEMKAMTYFLYSEVPFMKGYLNNELKHFVRGEAMQSQIPLPRVEIRGKLCR